MPYPLETFYNAASSKQHVEPTLIDAKFDQFNRMAFKNAIPSIHLMDEYNLAILIKNNIDEISSDIIQNNCSYAALLTDVKFISAFIRAINSIPIDYNTKLACNKVTYDYFTSTNPDSNIKQQYLNMSRVVNRDCITRLITIGLDENTACNLALCRYSSSNERVNVKRLNFALYHRDPEIITEQMVVWIYEKLFNRISDLFYATMLEVYTPEQYEDFGDEFAEVYGTVGLSVLIILNNMTSENIRKVLLGYEAEWKYNNQPAVRFSLHSLSNDYSKITRVVESMNYSGHSIP